MKKKLLKRIFNLTWLVLAALLTFTACSDDDDDNDDDTIVLDGTYISGTATGGESFIIDAKQMVEPSSDFETKVERDGMMYGIHYLTAGTLMFKEVAGDAKISYGVSDVATTTQTEETGEPFDFQRGNLVEDGTTEFTVTEAGLYYIITDKTSSTFWVMKINSFEISSTTDEATMVSGSTEGAVFELSGTDLRGSYKVRINTGWKIIADDIPFGGTDFPEDGIRPITSFGGSLSALTFDGSDIAFTPLPLHLTDFTFTWDPSIKGIAGITGTTTDAGERLPTDYSDYLIGFIGNAVMEADTSWGWGNLSYENLLPVKNGYIYTWTWSDVSIADTTDGRTWKFRKDNAWSFTLGFNNVTMSGSSAADFFAGSDDGNFGVATSKVYDMILEVDATSDTWKLYVAEEGGYLFDIWGLIGSATPNGWNDPDTEMTPNIDGTEWTWTGDLIEGEFKFRLNDSWDYQIGDDGAGGAAFSTNATAWVIAAGDVGNYTIVLDSETPDITITKN
ncbi:MAG: hypothetical protein A2X13_09035 [Bacteroidetes bacterium GWC2_33_15]|nr:MAG: hypothetical protein A2X10_01665 [Bacteroidetes bacterium GWA2_33_15]OFX49095.1 MAG: hypothetical protein A2X13_09035 [Bacteroidetes bacterium GWC2_33_15]OFX64863.1 MAG: hypothetical protein A2X15_05910 [Bacteroidetes bacterium GWB2_32_14]OFX68571.1 MAG: hypothetical protein A2X14_14475 [Bacteroidetes bacterium GWD2_33_33]HAN17415.1 hypothetical protein [Bacteroidales bacterium]